MNLQWGIKQTGDTIHQFHFTKIDDQTDTFLFTDLDKNEDYKQQINSITQKEQTIQKKDIKPLMKEIYEHKENYKTEASNDALFQKHFPNIQNKNFEDTYMFDKACQKTCVNQRCMDT